MLVIGEKNSVDWVLCFKISGLIRLEVVVLFWCYVNDSKNNRSCIRNMKVIFRWGEGIG